MMNFNFPKQKLNLNPNKSENISDVRFEKKLSECDNIRIRTLSHPYIQCFDTADWVTEKESSM